VKYARELYWGLVEWTDTEMGRLLNSLANSKVADNTVVIYTTDHGENKGDHGLWWKNNMYEHSAGVPLIVSWPERWVGGQRRTGACSFVDLVQTIVDLGGAQSPEDWDGDSLLPWLDDPNHAWKDVALSEYYGHYIASGFTMLRHDRYKYVYHSSFDEQHGPERELYDVVKDPSEFVNLANEPGYAGVMHSMHNLMLLELGEDPEDIEKRAREQLTKGYGREGARRPVKKDSP